MSEWTKQRLEQMITNGVEENLSLDYKRADSLAKTNEKRTEITKDVSSFANSSGGVLIYGIAEHTDKAGEHLPDSIDPIRREDFSREWLDQVIQTIQPRIDGVIIHPVTISESDKTVCYVVEVPKSHTAHMARDGRYHKRHNFTTARMEDYEVRDVMGRRTHPKLRASIYVNRGLPSRSDPREGIVTVWLENVGTVLARYVMVELEVPLDMKGPIAIDGSAFTKTTDQGVCQTFKLVLDGPLFPHSDTHLRRNFQKISNWEHLGGEKLSSTRHIKVSVFADEMPPIRATLDIGPVLMGMTPVQPVTPEQT